MSLRFDKIFGLGIMILVLFTSCRSTFPIPQQLDEQLPFDAGMIYTYSAIGPDNPYRFKMNANLFFKKFSMNGMMMIKRDAQPIYVQYFSDFGKNLILLSKMDVGEDWEVHYVLPEMEYDGLIEWVKEDLEVLLALDSNDKTQMFNYKGALAILKKVSSERRIVYLYELESLAPYKAMLLNQKNKILKTYYMDKEGEVSVKYHRPSVQFKYEKLNVTE